MPLFAGVCNRRGEDALADLADAARRQVDAGHLDRDCGGRILRRPGQAGLLADRQAIASAGTAAAVQLQVLPAADQGSTNDRCPGGLDRGASEHAPMRASRRPGR